jgi:membrane-associated protease RseP (regulator of RpoE activity)
VAEARDDQTLGPALNTPPPAREPGTLSGRLPPLFNLALFGLTAVSVLLAGIVLDDGKGGLPQALPRALAFAAALLGILLTHEMGHFLLARRHGVDATWPFFIPAPIFSLIGTLGAVIRLRQLPRTRAALIDIGAAGPLAGFAVTLPVLALGLRASHLVAASPEPAHFTLFDAVVSFARGGPWPSVRDAIDLGEPLAMQLLERLSFGDIPPGQTISLHPVAIAGWFGLLLTAVNLLPLGQLDGGHLLFGASPRLHRLLGPPLAALLLALGVFTPFTGWAFWGLLMGLWLAHHPALAAPEPSLSPARKLVLALSLAVFALSFCPAPVGMLLR